LGGSETAITCLTKNFSKDYTIYVAGDVEEETAENIRYVHFNNLKNLIKTTAFHSIIVSRYLNFYELYKNFSAYQTFIWGHDITLYAYGTDLSVEGILSKWASKITGCICQTEWHKNLFLSSFPQLKDKISTINNGINADLFNSKDITNVKKIANRFIYTSCSERGLYKLVQLWPSILENLPDAELLISSYNNFPKSEEDIKILEIITKTPSIKHMGKLNRTELYNLMATAEYWLYTSYFQETSCITSLELLASEVICLYYPVAGLVNTLGDYGIKISEGNEIDALLSLSIKKKTELKRKGKEYALSCSWKNRAIEWMKLMNIDNNNINIEDSKSTIDNTKLDMWKNLTVEPYYNFPVSKNWFGYSELKNYILNNIDLTKQYNILEIGSFEGCSSCFLSDILINNTLSTLTCVDPFISDGCSETDHSTLKYKFYSNINKTQNYNKINVVEKFSDDFYSTYNGSNFNFIYIDGEHSEKQILKDLDECFSLLDINGMIWCDDYNNKWKDIFDNWILLKNDYINVIHSGYQIAFIKKKNELKRKGNENIANECSELPFLQKLSKVEKRMFDLYESLSMPQAHTNILKKISETFTPNVIYDIGASTLHWTKAAKNVWPNSELCAFDAIEEAEKLYKSKDIKYNIGVISDQDNKIVKFYENKENPAGNSYYKEIGHPNSINVYPENSYIERKAMTLETVVKRNNFLLPDLVKIDVQGAELDILKGGMNIINNAKYLIIELQNVEYNRGAPLENVTIDFLNKNGWEIVEAKFSNNGPDADYLFINKNYRISNNNEVTKDIWVFCPGTYMHTSVIQYIENLSDNSKKTIISNDINYINDINPHKIIFLLNPSSSELFERNSLDKFINKNFAFLQLEPLSLHCHSNHIIGYFNKYSYLKQYPIYNYSKTNIRILNKNGITNCIHLPYNCIQSELDFLIQSNTNKKEYDFGFIYDWVRITGVKSFPIRPPRRNKITEFLIKNGFTVNLISGYGEDRDKELGKCKIILNIHGQISENLNPSPDECSNIFEHIRCDRLLKAGYTILSESSYDLDQDFIDKYPNLKIINYEDFFNLDVINNLIYELNIKNIYDKSQIREYRYNVCNKGQSSGLELNKYVKNCIDNIGSSNILNVCDIGCGTGEHSKLLFSQYPNFKFTGVDWSQITIDYLHKNISFFHEIVHCKSSNIPFNNKQFSLALCMENIEHLYSNDCIDAFKELKRISEYIILTVPKPEYIVNYSWLNYEINEAINDNIPLTLSDYIALESCVHKTGYYENSLIHAGFKKCEIEHPYNGIYYCKSDNLDISKIQYMGIDNNDLLKTINYKKKYIDLLHRSLNLDFIQNRPTKKIVDCFIFYNELDLLNYRLNILNDYVDYFVLVEATHSFVGKEKSLFYQENKELFKEFNHKIIHIVVDDFSHKYPNINIENGEQWNNEIFQRNCIKRGLDKLKLNDDDIFTVTDLDEIPDPKLLQKIKKNEINIDVVVIELDFYYYNLNCKINGTWPLSRMISYKKYKELGFSCEQIRKNMSFKIIPNAGWHLSYFGDEKFIKNKIENFGHQELNIADFTDENNILNRIKNQKDLYNRSSSIVNVEIEDNNNLPPKYDKYLTKYYTI
jgi:beta-1,4-mannosyl-glycoprotein beta-1,4-N-acetylglucosaminyltransferase